MHDLSYKARSHVSHAHRFPLFNCFLPDALYFLRYIIVTIVSLIATSRR